MNRSIENQINAETRREFGVHYTGEQDIFKVIRPLFLDELYRQFETVKADAAQLIEFHRKLTALTFFDPACGSGHFLAVTYRELRLLEWNVLKCQQNIRVHKPPARRVNITQFYGIEQMEFPQRAAIETLQSAEQELNKRFGMVSTPKRKPKIVLGNALRIDWNEILPKSQCSYILGNPPFAGAKVQNAEQKADMKTVFGKHSGIGLLDYVSCWFYKAAEYIDQTGICAGFVATSSIIQGEQVGILWSFLFGKKIKIHFAYPPFCWTSDVSGKAHVHCIIIGFGQIEVGTKNMNPYLIEGANVLLFNRQTPICDVPKLGIGNKPIDGGHYLFTEQEKIEFLRQEPAAEAYFKRWIGAAEFISGKHRWVLWLGDCPAGLLQTMPECVKRIKAVRQYRLQSKSSLTRELANQPTRFHVENMPKERFLVIPCTTSNRREYIPIGFIEPDVLVSNALMVLPNPTSFHFGVLTSAMHNDWMRRVCGRLENDYRYSAGVVYNNFPWSNPTQAQRLQIEESAKKVLNVRGKTPLSELYDPDTMPKALREAHRELDLMVDRSYRDEPFADAEERLTFLFSKIYASR